MKFPKISNGKKWIEKFFEFEEKIIFVFGQNLIGVRFLYPVYYIPEVELNPSKWTSTQTIQTGSEKNFEVRQRKSWTVFSVRKFIEQMGKTLYFRSSLEPLILDEEERETRRKGEGNRKNCVRWSRKLFLAARIESLKKSNAFLIVRGQTLPQLMSNNNRNQTGRNRNELREKRKLFLFLEKIFFDFSWEQCRSKWKWSSERKQRLFNLYGSAAELGPSLVQSLHNVLRMRKTTFQPKRSLSAVSETDRRRHSSLHLTRIFVTNWNFTLRNKMNEVFLETRWKFEFFSFSRWHWDLRSTPELISVRTSATFSKRRSFSSLSFI